MKEHHYEAYRSSIRQKSMTYWIDEDGFVRLEYKTTSRTQYVDKNGEISAK